MSSTVSVPWAPADCRHWGLLVVDKLRQGKGVASVLVAAAETRLKKRGCERVQIEYEYRPHEEHSRRLCKWYIIVSLVPY